ncbi:MAG: cytochrome c [Leptospiraceae bacterium]|nr:cytochrome c [Leptospiraceae bacterium]
MKNSKTTLFLIISLMAFALVFNCGEKKTDETTEPETKTEDTTKVASGPDASKGKEAYETNCSSCHGETGKGDGPAGAALNPKPRNFTADAAEWKNGKTQEGIEKTIKEGLTGTPMVSYAHLGDETIANIAAYILELGK